MAPARSLRTARENAEAQALGFRNAYEVRIRGGFTKARLGEITPTTPRPTGEQLRQARGHAGFLDLLREIDPESLVMIGSNLGDLERDDNGLWVEIPVRVFGPDGSERDYVLRRMSDEDLEFLIDQLDDLDADYSPDYDLNALLPAGYK